MTPTVIIITGTFIFFVRYINVTTIFLDPGVFKIPSECNNGTIVKKM